MTIAEALKMLDAGDADGVSVLIAAEGIRGAQGRSCECPVAKWLSRAVGQRCVVGMEYAWQTSGRAIYMPLSVLAFRRRFDRGEYPELVQQ